MAPRKDRRRSCIACSDGSGDQGWTTLASLELRALVKSLVLQVRVGDAEISVWLNRTAVVSSAMPDTTAKQTEYKSAVEPAVLSIVATLRRAGKGTRLVIGDGSASKIDGWLAYAGFTA